jgi:hypothetical protein
MLGTETALLQLPRGDFSRTWFAAGTTPSNSIFPSDISTPSTLIYFEYLYPIVYLHEVAYLSTVFGGCCYHELF